MLKCGPRDGGDYSLQEVVRRVVGDLGIPVAYGLKSGHVSRGNFTLPLGVHATFDAGEYSFAGPRGFGTEIGHCGVRCQIMTPKHIHLIGICGTAMASLAGMLQQRGHRVTGSDAAAYPPMSDFLASLGIEVAQPFSEKHLEPRPDLVIVGNAISRGNVELEYVLDQRLPFESMARVVYDEFLAGHERLVVAGTHGKTTTSSLLAWLLAEAQRAPSFLIGGIPENFGSSFAIGTGPEFVIEGDEYDTAFFDKGPKFLHYFPDAAILTSVEFDHADIYTQPRRSEDRIQTTGESDSAARLAGGVGWPYECG